MTGTTGGPVRIVHTPQDGTLLQGTCRGDGTAQVAKAQGWRWGRSLGAWYLPRTRDVPPKRPQIEATAAALREAGFDVEVSIDASTVDPAAALAAQAQRDVDRADRTRQRAIRHRELEDDHDQASRRISDGIPIGQPILAGHHSQRRHERDLERLQAHQDKALEASRVAAAAECAAQAAMAADALRHHPVVVGNRIDRLGAELRRAERALAQHRAGTDSPTGSEWDQATSERIAHTSAQLEHWQQVRAHQLTIGQALAVGPDSVAVGDLVRIGGHWSRVAKVNAKTVACETDYSWTSKVPWHKVVGHRPASVAQDVSASESPTG